MIADKYKDRYYLNGESVFRRWGIVIEEGGANELLREPDRKEQYSYSWGSDNGTERYVYHNVYESKSMTFKFTFLANSLEEYLIKRQDFYEYIKNIGYFKLYYTTLKREWTLLFNGVSSTEHKTELYKGGVVISTDNIVLLDDFLVSKLIKPREILTDGNLILTDGGIILFE